MFDVDYVQIGVPILVQHLLRKLTTCLHNLLVGILSIHTSY